MASNDPLKIHWKLGRIAFLNWDDRLRQRYPCAIATARINNGTTKLENEIKNNNKTCFIFNHSMTGQDVFFNIDFFDENANQIVNNIGWIKDTIGGNTVVRNVTANVSQNDKIVLNWDPPNTKCDGYLIKRVVEDSPGFDSIYQFEVISIINGSACSAGMLSNKVIIPLNISDEFSSLNIRNADKISHVSMEYAYSKIKIFWGSYDDALQYEVILWTPEFTKIKHFKNIHDTQFCLKIEEEFTYGSELFFCVQAVCRGGHKIESEWKKVLLVCYPPTNYEQLKKIGSGSFGDVYLVRDKDTNTLLAKKSVDKRIIIENDRSLSREISFMTTVSHPRIIQYYGSKETENSLEIFMEYMCGGSLRDIIKRQNRLAEDNIIFYTRQILEGITYLHNKIEPILHRDVKALNVLIDEHGNAKLCDFGCSKFTADNREGSMIHRGSETGSPYWMSPEVIRNEGYGRRSDIWSFGCTIVEMFTGSPPWFHLEPVAAMYQIATNKTQPVLPDGTSSLAQNLLTDCIFVEKKKRWYSKNLLQHDWLL